MKTLLKIMGVLVVAALVAAAAGVGYMYAAYPNVELTEYRIEATPERLARGKSLADHVTGCTACHAQRDWSRFSGAAKHETIGAGGAAFPLGPAGIMYAKHITPAALGSW